SPLVAALSPLGKRKQGMFRYREQMKKYDETLARIRADVDAAVLQEELNLRLSLPDPASLQQLVCEPSERLWERRFRDPDFLALRVGTSDLPSSLSVEDPDQDEHRRTTTPSLHRVPVSLALRAVGVAGVAGADAGRTAGWLAAQAASLHSPMDLRIVVLAGP